MPPKKELSKLVGDVMLNFPEKLGEPIDSGIRRTALKIKRKKPNADWLILMLAQFAPEHAIFSPNYVYEKKSKDKVVIKDLQVDNIDNFFTGLPVPNLSARDRRKRPINFIDPG